MISLCMIVKNEAHCLTRCLNSVKHCVDEIIVVDTGSTDNTAEIAQRLGAKVFHYQWQDDFAAARNFSLQQATGSWILYLDADEELASNSCDQLRALTTVSEAEGYYFEINNLSDQGDCLKHINVRLFKNKPQYRFTGKLHEQIEVDNVYNSGLSITHYGYLNSEWVIKNKAERNYRINQQMVDEDPTNAYYLYNLGTACLNLNDIAEAVKNYRLSLKYLDLKANYAPSVFMSYVSNLLKLGQIKEALIYINRCKTQFPDYVDMIYLEGEFYQTLGATKKSICCFEQCIALGENASGKYTTQTGVGSFYPCFKLAELYQAQGDLAKAISWQLQGFKQKANLVKKLNANDLQKLTTLVKLLAIAERSADLIIDILAQLPLSNSQSNYLAGLAYLFNDQYQEAVNYFDKISFNNQDKMYQPALLANVFAHWAQTPAKNSQDLITAIINDNDQLLPALTYINNQLLKLPTKTAPPPAAMLQVIDQLLAFSLTMLALKIITFYGCHSVDDKIALLLSAPVKDNRLELAAKLVLAQLKTDNTRADYYYVLGHYFFANQEYVLAQDMITKALGVNNDVVHYRKLLKKTYLKQSLKMVLTALDNYPDNPQLLDYLVDIYHQLAATS